MKRLVYEEVLLCFGVIYCCVPSIHSLSENVDSNIKDVQFSSITGKILPNDDLWFVPNWQLETVVHLKGGIQKAFLR